MRTFKELCEGKPSKAVRFMIDGLRRQSKRPDFHVDMVSFVRLRPYDDAPVCLGCAATCAAQEATGIDIKPSDVDAENWDGRSRIYLVDRDDMIAFEQAIDALRVSHVVRLGRYFGVDLPEPIETFELLTHGWESSLPEVERYAEQLESVGL